MKTGMSRWYGALAALGLLCLCAGGSALSAPRETALPARFEVLIPPDQDSEWCHPLQAGQLVHYQFSSRTPLGFSAHYHHGADGRTFYRRDEVRSAEGDIRASVDADYCLFWHNYDDFSATLSVDLSLR